MWRVGRGNIFVRQMFIDGSITDMHGEATRKCVILIFFSGEQLRQRVRKICKAFRVNIYPCPVSNEERRETTIGVLQRLEDMRKVKKLYIYIYCISNLLGAAKMRVKKKRGGTYKKIASHRAYTCSVIDGILYTFYAVFCPGLQRLPGSSYEDSGRCCTQYPYVEDSTH